MPISGGRSRGGNFRRPTSNGSKGTSLRQLQLQAQLAGQVAEQTADVVDALTFGRYDRSGYSIIPDYLEPVGSSGFYLPANDAPVDPWDCEQYPNSLLCGGGLALDGSGAIGLGNAIAGVGLDELVTNGCEICVRIDTNLFLMPLPSTTVCYRRPGCRPLPRRPQPAEVPRAGFLPNLAEPVWTAASFPEATACYNELILQHTEFRGTSPPYTPYNYTISSTSFFSTYVGQPLGYYTHAGYYDYYGDYTALQWHLTFFSLLPNGATRISTYRFPHYGDDRGIRWSDYPPSVARAFPAPAWVNRNCVPTPLPDLPTVPPYRPNRPPMCDCQETQDLLRLIAKRLGTQNYPVTVPKNLVDEKEEVEKQESLTELTAWTIKQMDALVGQFPIEIQIQDADPSRAGDQTRKISLANIAESLAEVYSLSVRSAVGSDIHTSFLMRLAAEVIATKNASLITQDYAKANASYLGYKGNTVKRKVNYAFNVTNLSNLEKILNESSKTIIGWQDEDRNTVQAYLEKLMFAAGIIKQVYFRPDAMKDQLLNEIAGILGTNNSEPEAGEEEALDEADQQWIAFLREINNAEGGFNKNSPIKPKVADPSVSTEESIDVDFTGFDLIPNIDGEVEGNGNSDQ